LIFIEPVGETLYFFMFSEWAWQINHTVRLGLGLNLLAFNAASNGNISTFENLGRRTSGSCAQFDVGVPNLDLAWVPALKKPLSQNCVQRRGSFLNARQRYSPNFRETEDGGKTR
jgi:hypothetical protein